MKSLNFYTFLWLINLELNNQNSLNRGIVMKKIIVIFVIILSVFGLGCTSQNDSVSDQDDESTVPADQQYIQGIWQGILEVSGAKLRIVFNISAGQNSTLTATMDSPDQGVIGIPVDKVTFQNDNLDLEVLSIPGVYNGRFSEDNQTINGHWEQSGQSFPLILQRIDKAPVLNRPQEPKRPYPYKDEEVIYKNETTGIELAGTLTLPTSEGPSPAVLLITGSGAQDRNETIVGHRPFLVLSDYLTRRGIAVLRVDDRGIGGSNGNVSQATSEDFAGDVLTGVEYLKGREEIDPEKIGLIGHSEGGIIAPMVAVRSEDVAFIVMMAGSGLTGEEILYLQAGFYVGAGYRGEPCGMTGGKITVFGNARDYVGEHLCGGEITIKGNAGILPGISNKGGKIIIEGDTAMPGSEMTKGTIIVKGTVTEMMPVYKKEGIETIDGVEYTKYVGDVVVDGAGELFVK
jgi:hypothetical protein